MLSHLFAALVTPPVASCLLPEALLAASPDFQTKLGYPLPPPNGANLSTASKANAQKYNTLSLVLEQPFKDTIGEAGQLRPQRCTSSLQAEHSMAWHGTAQHNYSKGQRAEPLQTPAGAAKTQSSAQSACADHLCAGFVHAACWDRGPLAASMGPA